ncbi:MAG: hypothetical protein H6605_00335 [Flavobacteriales bacterium]|nr:hypothetical protein [Flavobacteriales bacterium]
MKFSYLINKPKTDFSKKFLLVLSAFTFFYAVGMDAREMPSSKDKLHPADPVDGCRVCMDSIPKENIVARFYEPDIIIYKSKHFDYNPGQALYIRYTKGTETKEAFLFGDNMVYVNNLVIDTISLIPGKTPQLSIDLFASGSHSYGMNGGWNLEYRFFGIWDLNKMKEVFSAFPSYHSYSSETETTDSDSILSVESVCDYSYTLSLNRGKKEIVIENIQFTREGECSEAPDKETGTYRFENGSFKKL